MKILISSLLRIGDFLMHQQVRNRIMEQYPDAEFTWLLQDIAPSITELIPPGDHAIMFPRKSLQDVARLKTVPIGAPEMILNQWLNIFSGAQFDWAINLGHDKVSGYILSEIHARTKSGLQWDGSSWQGFENQWLSYLNNHMPSGSKSEYHYCDILLKMLDIEAAPPIAQQNNSNLILLQPFTSDNKKNWSLDSWSRIQQWIGKNTNCRAVIVGAPFEETELRKKFAPENIWIGGLGDLQRLVKQSRLVIGGDTGVIHMAALEKIPSVMLSLGSSDPVKTSAYGQGHWIISAKTECRPCHHKQDCTKVSHLCSEDLHPEKVENFLDYLINPTGPLNWKQNESVDILETAFVGGSLRLFNMSGQDAPALNEGSHERRSNTLLQSGN